MYIMFFLFFFQSINRLTGWFPSNEVFYQSDCELVTFDTVELFFLRKEYIYILSRGGVTSHCFSSCHSQQQSCINKNVLKSVIFLSIGIFTGEIICRFTGLVQKVAEFGNLTENWRGT